MALRITPGYKSLNLYFDQPTNAYNVDDVDSGGTTQAVQNDIRTDLQGLKVWISDESWGSSTPTVDELYYNGPFQGYLAIDKLSQTSTDPLADNTVYYIKYAFISKIQPNQYTYLPIVGGVSSEQTGITLDVALPLQGFLTRDPIEIPTDENGSNGVFTDAIGEFKVYRYSQDISTSSDVSYSIKTSGLPPEPVATGGVEASFSTEESSKNVYTVSALTDLTGTITLQATYTDPLNNANTITIEQVLNVSKRRPGQTAPLVVLTATGQVFVLTEDSSGSSKSPANLKITATASNITNPTYTWTLDPNGTNTPIEGTGSGYTNGTFTGTTLNAGKDELTISNSFFTGATPQFKLFKVVAESGIVGSTINVSDLMSIYYLKEGSDSLAMGLINENQTVTLDKTGLVISGLPIESEAVVVEGTTQLSAPVVAFAVNSQSGFNSTLTINIAANNPVNGKPAGYIKATEIVANQAYATITATVAGTTLSKVLTVNRVQDGADGTNIDAQLTNDFHAVPTAADGTGAVYTGASTTIEVYKNGVLQTSGFTFYVSGLQNIKYRGTGDTSDRTGTGTTNGALTATSGTAIVDIVELSSDSGYVDITARQTSDSQLFTERFSLSRNKAGIIGKDAVIYQIKPNAKAISKQSSDVGTDGIHTPGNLIFSVYKTVGNNTAALLTDQSLYYIQWNSPDQEPPNTDASAQLLPALGYVSVVLANSLDKSSVNLKLLYKNSVDNYTQLDREEVPVVFKGTKGDSGTSVDIVFARGSSPPALTGTNNPPNINWSTTVSTAPGTGILWSSTGYSSDGGTTWVWDTAVQVEGTTGSNGESVAEISAFTRTANDLSSTSITGGSYDFSNKTLTVPTGGNVTWYSYIPVGTTPIWEIRTTAAVTAPTTVDNILTWSTPVKTAQEGPSGTSVDIIFKRSATVLGPSDKPTSTDNPPTGTGVNSGWSTTVADATGTNPLYSSTGFSINGTTWTWDNPVRVEGATGSDGESIAEISVFYRSSTPQNTNPTGGVYSFTTKSLTTNPTTGTIPNTIEWTAAIPSGTDPIWESRAVAVGGKTGNNTNTLTWSAPVKVSQNGTDGKVVYTARVWRQVAIAPGAPTGGNFNASTGVLTAPVDWSITQPAVSTIPTYATEYTFVVNPGTTTNAGGTWSTPFIDAVQGSDGSAQERVELYLATADGSTPTKPTSVLYTITGAVLGTQSGGTAGWSLTMPAIPAVPGAVFMTTAVASSSTPGTQITLGSWSNPVKVAQKGDTGNPARGVDISGAASINYNTTTNTYSPASVTLTALPQNITPTSYTWTSPDSTATFSGQSGATIVMTPNGTPSSITVKVVVTDGTNSAEKTITIAISNNGTPGLPGTPARGVDISGAAGLRYNTNTSSYSPTTLSLTALPQNITPTSYTWTSPDSTATFSANAATVIMTPNGTPSVIKVKVVVSDGTNSAEKTITIAVANDGAAGQVGQHGKKSAAPSIYTWTSSASAPTKPTSSVYYWNTVDGNTAGSLTIVGNVGSAGSKGYWYTSSAAASTAIAETTGDYLWEITAPLTVDAATWTGTYPNQTLTAVDSTTITWSSYTPIAIGYLSAGTPGTPGSGSYSIARASGQSISAPTDAEVNAATGRTTGPIDGDVAVVYISGQGSTSYRRLGGSWSVISQYLSGDVIVQGTIDANRLQIGNNTGSSRTVLTNNKIEIYESNVLRVKIGNLA
jgi:hypothetical protein